MKNATGRKGENTISRTMKKTIISINGNNVYIKNEVGCRRALGVYGKHGGGGDSHWTSVFRQKAAKKKKRRKKVCGNDNGR